VVHLHYLSTKIHIGNLNSSIIQQLINHLKRFQTISNTKNASKTSFFAPKNAQKHAFLHYFLSKSLKNCPFQQKTGSKFIKKSRKMCFFAPLMVQSDLAKAKNFHGV